LQRGFGSRACGQRSRAKAHHGIRNGTE
jgi:hypothetical protein